MLGVTVCVAVLGLYLSTKENGRQRAERRRQPRRELLLDVVRELKQLAAQTEIVLPGSGYFDSSGLAAQKHRLRVALNFFPPNELKLTRAAADERDLTQQTAQAAIAPASAELRAELERLESFTD